MQGNPSQQDSGEPQDERSFIEKATDLFSAMSRWFDQAWVKINRLTETNYELGFQLAQQGRIDDAIMRFRITLWLAPNHEPTLYNLGCLYHHKGENQKALALFSRLIRANPKHLNALYMIATIDPALLKPEMRPQTVPMVQLIEYFDKYASFYDAERAEKLYRLPAIMHQLLRPMLGTDIAKDDMLDIGCGTGLVGAEFREEFANIIGVDVSNEMLKIAYRRMDKRGVRIYNQLMHQDIRQFLAQEKPPQFNVVAAMDVLPYLGELEHFAKHLSPVVRAGGIVALSFDPYHEQQGFGVMPKTGYFGHSLAYVQQAMQAAGFELTRRGEVEAMSGHHVQLCFFSKASGTGHDSDSSSG